MLPVPITSRVPAVETPVTYNSLNVPKLDRVVKPVMFILFT